MAVLPIRIIGDPVLRTVAEPVTDFGPGLRRLVADMLETMEDVDGAGLAAPQVGVSQRVFTYQMDGVRGHVVNPVLELSDEFQEDMVEGCLSIPGVAFPVRRRARAVVRGSDADGAPVEFEAAGLLARIAQHETDHLDGVLFPDRLEGDDRRAALRAIRSIDYSSQVDKTVGKRAARIGSAFGAGKAAPGSAFGAGPRR
ncbi:peptide deformylase [Sinomonas atrocyanea]|uniref:peptide deformylase n=1 Tax=Sinomonas atrocyanea TaxID=37927 RepID=UPI0027893C84|nr:peptide deformylase [Sinomonas atrocyanea]MDQ0259966.1 peptide deformylase [Sinomonas atrocyanea]MDR6619987.1 peptide deformylase [Sinomonas atrocyanea]